MRIPLRLSSLHLLVNLLMTHSRRLGLCYGVNLVPDFLRIQRVAFLGDNVNILYVAKMTQNSRFLLLCGFPLSTTFYTVFLP
jgi:hypothetical protein